MSDGCRKEMTHAESKISHNKARKNFKTIVIN